MEVEQTSHDAQCTINHQRLENMLTSVRNLIQMGKAEEARRLANGLKGTELECEMLEAFEPSDLNHCEEGHPVVASEWSQITPTRWLAQCTTCFAQYEAEQKARVAAEEAERRRPYRHRPPEELYKILRAIGVPSRYLNATVKRLESLADSLYLTGDRGTGKTHNAAAMVKEIMLDKTPDHGRCGIRWISAVDLLLEIRGSFRDGSEQSEDGIIEDYGECRLLILDDLGAEKTSEWSLQTLYTIIDRRYREERQTIITSNLSLDELAAQVDDRIASRLSELCRVVVLAGPDRRVTRGKERG